MVWAAGELQVQPAASHQQGHAPLLQLTGDAGFSLRLKFLQGDRLIGIAQIQQVVGHPGLLLAVGLAVPTLIPRYSCLESTLITGRFSRSAISIAVLPLAVGPSSVITRGSGCVNNRAGCTPG